jgi:hypothetical protein
MKKTAVAVIGCILSVAMIAGCGASTAPEDAGSSEDTRTDSFNGEVRRVRQGDFEYDIPADWSKSDAMSTENVCLYISDNANPEDEPSNVTVEIHNTGSEAPAFEDLKRSNAFDEAMVRGIVSQELADITIEQSFTVPLGGVFQASYSLPGNDGKRVKQIMYLPVLDNYAILVFATDFGDKIVPPAREVAELILRTMESSN